MTNSDCKETLLVTEVSCSPQRAHLSIFASCSFYQYGAAYSTVHVLALDLLKEGPDISKA